MAAKVVAFGLVILNVVLQVWGDADFIKKSCEVTRYPEGCVESLSGQASSIGENEQQLALTALSVSVTRTQACASFLKTLNQGTKAVKDCVEHIDSSVFHLNQSVKELGLVGKPNENSAVHVGNVQTWVSSAITDQTTCLDGLEGTNVKAELKESVTPRIKDASQATSNALALIDRFATKQDVPKP